MQTKPIFSVENTHGILQRFNANFDATSEGLGWSSAFASMQRERPFEGRFEPRADCLMVLHRDGPVDVTFRMEGQTVARRIPKGGLFFLPADQECDVTLHSDLDTTHIYLRADLFSESSGESRGRAARLAPMFGQSDPVLEHLGGAIGEAIRDGSAGSSLFVDPLVMAIASRFIALDHNGPRPVQPRRPNQLTSRQIRSLREFVESELRGDIRLSKMAEICGLSTEYFVRLFKATLGLSPYQYVIGRRVERAKTLLDQDQQSLAEIALECGFSHQEHMTRMFRRFTGLTPGRYRRGG
jgi:AraC family transcriptional regulator